MLQLFTFFIFMLADVVIDLNNVSLLFGRGVTHPCHTLIPARMVR